METNSKQDYFSIREFVALSMRYKFFIGSVTGLFAVLAVVIAISLPNQYKSQVLVAPSEEQQGGGLAALASQFGGLASLAGINIGGKRTNNTDMMLAVLRSRQFIIDFIERHELLVPLMAASHWDQPTDTLVIDLSIYDPESKKWVRNVTAPRQPKPSNLEAYEEFFDRLYVDNSDKSGVVKLSFEFYSPFLAQQWLALLISDLNAFVRDIEMVESRKSIEFLKKQIKSTDVTELQNIFFQLIQEQSKKAMLAEARENFVFKVIDPAFAPEKKSRPARALICMLVTIFGFLLALFSVHVKQSLLHSAK